MRVLQTQLPPSTAEKTLVSPQVFAGLLQVSLSTVYRMIETHQLRAVPVGLRLYRIPLSEFDRLLSAAPEDAREARPAGSEAARA